MPSGTHPGRTPTNPMCGCPGAGQASQAKPVAANKFAQGWPGAQPINLRRQAVFAGPGGGLVRAKQGYGPS